MSNRNSWPPFICRGELAICIVTDDNYVEIISEEEGFTTTFSEMDSSTTFLPDLCASISFDAFDGFLDKICKANGYSDATVHYMI